MDGHARPGPKIEQNGLERVLEIRWTHSPNQTIPATWTTLSVLGAALRSRVPRADPTQKSTARTSAETSFTWRCESAGSGSSSEGVQQCLNYGTCINVHAVIKPVFATPGATAPTRPFVNDRSWRRHPSPSSAEANCYDESPCRAQQEEDSSRGVARFPQAATPRSVPKIFGPSISSASEPLRTGRHVSDDHIKTLSRREGWTLRRTAKDLLPTEAVAKCGRSISSKGASNSVTVRVNQGSGRAFYSGVATCRSVWHCPVCARKITSSRLASIAQATRDHVAAGGSVYVATFTVPHDRSCNLKSLRTALSACFSSTISGKPWLKAKFGAGLVDYIRCLEVTYGAKGWNPRLHCIFYFDGDDPRGSESFGRWLFKRYARVVEKRGLGHCNPRVWSFQRAREPAAVAGYITKWGSSIKADTSQAPSSAAGSRTPWQILRDVYDRKEARDRALFREYAAAFKGARHLTGGAVLRRLYGGPEREDATETEDRTVLLMDIDGWRYVLNARLECAVLEAAEKHQGRELLAEVHAMGVPRAFIRLPPRSPPRRTTVLVRLLNHLVLEIKGSSLARTALRIISRDRYLSHRYGDDPPSTQYTTHG